MSWCTNQGPSFNNNLQRYPKLSNFYSRCQMSQNDNRLTPGKRQALPKNETLKGGKGSKVRRRKIKTDDNFDNRGAEPIYSGFSNIVNKATAGPKKQGGKLRKRRIK
jgi:hypothetical protein